MTPRRGFTGAGVAAVLSAGILMPAVAQVPAPLPQPADIGLAQIAPPIPRPHPERVTNDPIGDFLGAAAALFGLNDEADGNPQPLLVDLSSPDFLLTSAYRRLRAADYDSAVRIARAMVDPAGVLLIEWLIATDGYPDTSSALLAEAAAAVPDWPDQTLMQIRFEQALAREELSAGALIEALAGKGPVLESTTILLAQSYLALRRDEEAAALIRPYWRERSFSRQTEDTVLAEFGQYLTADDHHWRMSRLFYDGENEAGLRAAEQLSADTQKLAIAWSAVNDGRSNAAALLTAVPANLRSDPGYLYARLRLLVRSSAVSEAAALLMVTPTDPSVLIDPEAWASQRLFVARQLVDRGDAATAYQILADHSAQRRTNIVKIEFQAGWTALRLLGDPESAIGHFETLATSSTFPLSQSRAHYWLGRSYDALGDAGNAQRNFEIAAGYHTSFYGQLAITRLEGDEIPLAPEPAINEAMRAQFADNDLAQAMLWLYGLDRCEAADLIARFLADTLTDPVEIAVLAQLAESRGDHQLALQIGKLAANRGLAVDSVAFSTAVIPDEMASDHVELALIFAVARQESSFNISAESTAGALGLLQILPGTAREMARLVGLPYSEARLTADPEYNAVLGGAYLGTLLDRYGGNHALALAAFNAGFTRADRWIEIYGDPRSPSTDPIDWIERIPFDETRNYIMRVLENLQVYRARLGDPSLNLAADLGL